MSPTANRRTRVTLTTEYHLEAAAGAVTADDADVRWVEAGADESVHVVMCEVLHRVFRSTHGEVQRITHCEVFIRLRI